jgi:hypothetical protein
LTYSFYDGGVIFDGTVPITDATARVMWVSLDANYWFGDSTSLNGVQNDATRQKNSRVGATASIPLTRHQSIKLSYSDGAYIRYGGNYQNVSAGWQYSWLGRPN